MKIKRREEWNPDGPQCETCDITFTTFRRRHHCRFCAKCICDACSPNEFLSERICNPCVVSCSENSELREKFDKMQAKNMSKMKGLHDEISGLRDAERKMLAQLSTSQNLIFELRQQIEVSSNDDRIADLRGEVQRWRKSYQATVTECDKLKMTITTKAQAFINLSNDYKAAQSNIDQLTALKEELQRQEAKRVEKLTLENLEKDKENAKLTGLLEASKLQLEELRSERVEQMEMVKMKSSELEQCQKELSVKTAEVIALTDQLAEITAHASTSSEETNDLPSTPKTKKVPFTVKSSNSSSSYQPQPPPYHNGGENAPPVNSSLSMKSPNKLTSPTTSRGIYSALNAFRRVPSSSPAKSLNSANTRQFMGF